MKKKSHKGLLVVNGYLRTPKFTEIYDMISDACSAYGMSVDVVQNDELLAVINTPDIGERDNRKKNMEYDFCIFWDKDIMLAGYLESIGVRTINCSAAIELCDDKAKTHLKLMQDKVLMPKTVIAPMTYSGIGYTNYDFLGRVMEELSFPIVVKERFGSFGMQVYKADSPEQLHELTALHGDKQLIYQEFIRTENNCDVRINMIGNEVVAAMKRTAGKNDFRSNITNGGTMQPYTPKDEDIAVCRTVMKSLKLDYAGIDLLKSTDGGTYVCEVNSNAHFKNIYDCTGVNCAQKLIEYIEKLYERS